jgi:hypothetical protein
LCGPEETELSLIAPDADVTRGGLRRRVSSINQAPAHVRVSFVFLAAPLVRGLTHTSRAIKHVDPSVSSIDSCRRPMTAPPWFSAVRRTDARPWTLRATLTG